jgi:hypothetical protein
MARSGYLPFNWRLSSKERANRRANQNASRRSPNYPTITDTNTTKSGCRPLMPDQKQRTSTKNPTFSSFLVFFFRASPLPTSTSRVCVVSKLKKHCRIKLAYYITCQRQYSSSYERCCMNQPTSMKTGYSANSYDSLCSLGHRNH